MQILKYPYVMEEMSLWWQVVRCVQKPLFQGSLPEFLIEGWCLPWEWKESNAGLDRAPSRGLHLPSSTHFLSPSDEMRLQTSRDRFPFLIFLIQGLVAKKVFFFLKRTPRRKMCGTHKDAGLFVHLHRMCLPAGTTWEYGIISVEKARWQEGGVGAILLPAVSFHLGFK